MTGLWIVERRHQGDRYRYGNLIQTKVIEFDKYKDAARMLIWLGSGYRIIKQTKRGRVTCTQHPRTEKAINNTIKLFHDNSPKSTESLDTTVVAQ